MSEVRFIVQRAKNALEKDWYQAIAYVNGEKRIGYGTTHQRAIDNALRCQTCWGTKEVTDHAGMDNEETRACPDCVGVKEFTDMTGVDGNLDR